MNEITINGNEYPCRQTMGAFLRFKRETGREATDIKQELTDVLTFIYCCAASACDADHVEFNYTLNKVTPTRLLPLPWDNATTTTHETAPAPQLSKEKARARFAMLVKRERK